MSSATVVIGALRVKTQKKRKKDEFANSMDLDKATHDAWIYIVSLESLTFQYTIAWTKPF